MDKRVLFSIVFVAFLILAVGFVVAEENTTGDELPDAPLISTDGSEEIDLGYQCIEDKVDEKNVLSLEEAVFVSLALGGNSKADTAFSNNKKSGEDCWPKTGCTIKETAQVLLAKDGDNGAENWLGTKNKTASELMWYLQIDIQKHEASTCTIKYDGKTYNAKIREDMTFETGAGSCLSKSASGYWLRISESCLDNEFEISCDEDFVTSLLYQKNSAGTVFVSSKTSSSASLGKTTEKVNAYCFRTGQNCDYEGTLWAALAFNRIGRETDAFMPYLNAYAEDNKRFFPSAFLYILSSGDEQYSEIVQSQKQNKYWQEGGTSSTQRMFDTSLAMLALSGTGASELESAKEYLLEIQDKESGCWNNDNIRDTAFILYSGWPRYSGGGGGGGSGIILCTELGKFCEPQFACLEAGGSIDSALECTNYRDVCCSIPVREESCTEKGGLVCSSTQECSGSLTSSSDGSCCLGGACIEIQSEETCEVFGNICRSSCADGEESTLGTCAISGEICCAKSEDSEGFSIWWIIILLLLIILVVIGIIYRNKLQILWHKFRKGGGAQQPRLTQGPPSPPRGFSPRTMQFGMPPRRIITPVSGRRIASEREKEMEETLRKLKEMSK